MYGFFPTTISGHMCLRKIPFYSTMKAGVTHFAKCLALEEAENGIRVNIVSPGNIRTPFYKSHKTMPWKTYESPFSFLKHTHHTSFLPLFSPAALTRSSPSLANFTP